jgi:hypothetical protein
MKSSFYRRRDIQPTGAVAGQTRWALGHGAWLVVVQAPQHIHKCY